MPFPLKSPSDRFVEARRRFCRLSLSLPLLAACKQPSRAILPVGSQLPPMELPMLDGGMHRLSPASTPCLINFWATWCPPCRAEMRSLARLARDAEGHGLRLLAISVDEDPHLVREFIRQLGLDFAVLLDPGGKHVAERMGVEVYPTSFLVDRQGRVAQVWVGERDWGAADVRAAIDRHLSL